MERSGIGLSVDAAGLGVDEDGRINHNPLTSAFNRLHIRNRDDDGSDVSRGLHHPSLEIRKIVF
jgi:hypothetical protein